MIVSKGGGGWGGCCFFQAEDGIRDYDVTGVQTCALPICKGIPHDTVPVWGLKIKDLLDGQHPNYPHWKLQEKLIKHGYLIEKCNECGEDRLRIDDLKGPMLLDYLDNDQSNRHIDNLRLLCFNCYFLFKKDVEPNMKHRPLTKSSLKIHKAFGITHDEPPSSPPFDPGSISIEDVQSWISEESSNSS